MVGGGTSTGNTWTLQSVELFDFYKIGIAVTNKDNQTQDASLATVFYYSTSDTESTSIPIMVYGVSNLRVIKTTRYRLTFPTSD